MMAAMSSRLLMIVGCVLAGLLMATVAVFLFVGFHDGGTDARMSADAGGRSHSVGIDGAASVPPVAGVGDVPDALWSLTLPAPEGGERAMASWRGRPVVVNFWATWCAPCVEEMPDLDRLQREHPGVQFVGIGIDSAANIRTFLQKVQVEYPLMMFETGGTTAMRGLGNRSGGLPYTLVLDAQGRLTHTILGRVDPADLAARLPQ